MAADSNQKIKSILQLYDAIPDHERIIVDVLRAIVAEQLPAYCKAGHQQTDLL